MIEEEEERDGYIADPLLEIAEPGAKASGLIQKYAGRVLLITSHACAVNCRYCFRRHFPYEDSPRSLDEFQPAIDAIAEDESITEVILSGGDPLVRTDEWLAMLIEKLSAIPHLNRLARSHTVADRHSAASDAGNDRLADWKSIDAVHGGSRQSRK